jgi:cytochrome c2
LSPRGIAALVAGLLATGAGAPRLAATEGDPARGALVFQRCQACHALRPEERNLPGPTLAGLFGRPAGSVTGFGYSPVLEAAGRGGALVWTEAALDRFLADPAAFLPGNWMATTAVPDAAERADLIAYLRSGRP